MTRKGCIRKFMIVVKVYEGSWYPTGAMDVRTIDMFSVWVDRIPNSDDVKKAVLGVGSAK